MRDPAAASTIAPRPDRRVEPFDALLPRTLDWFERLPRERRPVELLRSFPRIANLLAANWAEPDAMRAYLDSLLMNRRGERQGFPLGIISELSDLHSFIKGHSRIRR